MTLYKVALSILVLLKRWIDVVMSKTNEPRCKTRASSPPRHQLKVSVVSVRSPHLRNYH